MRLEKETLILNPHGLTQKFNSLDTDIEEIKQDVATGKQTHGVGLVKANDTTIQLVNENEEVISTVTIPADTDTKVTQTLSSTNANYPLILGKNTTSTTTNYTDTVLRNNSIYANPSTGVLTAPVLKSNNYLQIKNQGINVASTYSGAYVDEIILYTGIKFVSSNLMPIVHITGFAYGGSCPIDLSIVFYIYSDKLCNQGVVDNGGWHPDVYLFKYTKNSTDYVAIAMRPSSYVYYPTVSADVINESLGKLTNIDLSLFEFQFTAKDAASVIPEPDNGVTCIQVPYKVNYNPKPTLTIQGNSTNIGTYDGADAATINITKSSIGLGNVENKSSATIRGELTASNVTTALGYTPANGVNYLPLTAGSSVPLSNSLYITKAGECGVEVNNTQSTNPNQVAFIVGSSGNGGIYSRKHNKWIVYADSNGNVTLNGNAVTASSASTATIANYLSIVAKNEIRFAAKPSSAQTIYVGYKWHDGTSDAKINRYKFCNGNAAATEVEASTFYGALTGNVTGNVTGTASGNVPLKSSPTDLNTIYDTSVTNITGSLTNGPTTYGYGEVFTMAYRKPSGNTIPDYAAQIYMHYNASTTKNTMYYRTSQASAWNAWQQVAHAAPQTALGSVTQPIYMESDGTLKVASQVAELDSNGLILSSQLPSYVDDVIEAYYYNNKMYKEAAHTTQLTGESSKIYVDLSTNKTYRWSGSAYVEISASLALGENSSTAYRGDRGKIAYDHSQTTSGNPHNVTKTDIGLSNVENKSSATIRGELTSSNVTTALGYTPVNSNTTAYVYYGGNDQGLGSGTTAEKAKEYFVDSSKVPAGMVKFFYNTSGAEFTTIFSKAPGSSYGSVLKWGYSDRYLRILRYQSGTWESTDWEKIDAGYADSAGYVTGLRYSILDANNGSIDDLLTGNDLTFTRVSHSNIGWYSNDGLILNIPWSTAYGRQIALDDNDNWMATRAKNSTSGWTEWDRIVTKSYGDTIYMQKNGNDTVLLQNLITGNTAKAGGLDEVTVTKVGSAVSNKSFGLPASGITIEYSTDGGQTWTDYGAADTTKAGLFCETRPMYFYAGKRTTNGTGTTGDQLRITIEPKDGRYVTFYGIYCWVTCEGVRATMDVQKSTIGAPNTFTEVFSGQALSGWPGNNIRYWSAGNITFGGASSQTNNGYKFRIIFKVNEITNTNYGKFGVNDIRFFGLATYNQGTSLGRNVLSKNTIYSWDEDMNVTFPAKLIAPIIQTGTDSTSYFQSQKFRGQGDANTYYHAIDFGYGGHDQVDFYEYGGLYNFWKNQGAGTSSAILLGKITTNGWEGNVVGNVTGHSSLDLPLTGGTLTGDLILQVSSGNSPAIIFQRGTYTDSLNDWEIRDKGGLLYFGQRGSNSTAFDSSIYLDNSGGVHATTFSGSFVGTNNKSGAGDGKTGVWLNNTGNAYLVGPANGGSKIHFYYNQATSATSYIHESASGTLKLYNNVSVSNALYVTANTYVTGALGTGGRTAYNDTDHFGCWLTTNGEVHTAGSATSGGAISFHYNKSASVTSYIAETASGTITVGGHLKTTNNIYGGSAIGTGGRTSNTDVSTSGSWLTSDGCLSFVRNATSGGLIQFHFNSAASATSTIDETASGRLKVSGELYTGSNIVIDTNAKYIHSKFKDGTNRILCGVNADNENLFGYGSFNDQIGSTHLQGNTVSIKSRGSIYLQPSSTTWLTVSAGNAVISTTAGTGVYYKVKNSHHEGSLYVSDSSTGNFGLYSNTLGKWAFYVAASGNLCYLPVAGTYVFTTSANCRIESNGQIGRSSSSSKRYKHDIKPLINYKDILNIPVVSFKFNNDYLPQEDPCYGVDVPGFIAEDVEKYYPIATEYSDGKVENWNFRHIIPPMLAVEQEHEKRINELEARIEQLSQENERLKQKIEAIT